MCAYADHSMRACVHLPLSLSISLALGRFLFVTHARTHSDSSMLHNRNSASCQSLDSLHRITYYVYVRSSSSSIFHYSILLCTRVVVAYSIFLLHPACLPSRRHSMCRPTVHYVLKFITCRGGRSAHRSMSLSPAGPHAMPTFLRSLPCPSVSPSRTDFSLYISVSAYILYLRSTGQLGLEEFGKILLTDGS